MSQSDHTSDRRPRMAMPVLLAFLALAWLGARWLEFLCDDAFITFRYVSNARDGHGLVWNPPPFLPVEGYTEFLWAVLLWAVWSCFGIDPPHAANWISILCGLGMVVVTAVAAWRLRAPTGASLSAFVAPLTLLVVVGNRTFLQWMTSGLGTALFNLTIVSWAVFAFRSMARLSTGWLAGWATLAALAALTRPDGLLLVAATAFVAILARATGRLGTRQAWLGLLPLSAIVAHVAWRRWFYGEWLPNTYFAKVTAPWPEAGWRYLQCFAFENGTWLLIPVAMTWLIVEWRRRCLPSLLTVWLPATVATATVAVQAGYYIVVVGGDHFEYRVLSPLVPLGALAIAGMSARIRGSGTAIATMVVLAAASSVTWLHFALAEPKLAPDYDPLARHVPSCLQPVARWYDRRRLWLQTHFVCGPTPRIDLSLAHCLSVVPERRREPIDQEDYPVAALAAVGILGWVMPDCAVIDRLGLNDWVTARLPVADWIRQQLPPELVASALAAADQNADAVLSREELERMVAAWPGNTPESSRVLAGILIVLFAEQHPDGITTAEAAGIPPYFANHRLMAHERLAPADYIAAFDPNVTVEGTKVTTRRRERPLGARRIIEIEREWRESVGRKGK